MTREEIENILNLALSGDEECIKLAISLLEANAKITYSNYLKINQPWLFDFPYDFTHFYNFFVPEYMRFLNLIEIHQNLCTGKFEYSML